MYLCVPANAIPLLEGPSLLLLTPHPSFSSKSLKLYSRTSFLLTVFHLKAPIVGISPTPTAGLSTFTPETIICRWGSKTKSFLKLQFYWQILDPRSFEYKCGALLTISLWAPPVPPMWLRSWCSAGTLACFMWRYVSLSVFLMRYILFHSLPTLKFYSPLPNTLSSVLDHQSSTLSYPYLLLPEPIFNIREQVLNKYWMNILAERSTWGFPSSIRVDFCLLRNRYWWNISHMKN